MEPTFAQETFPQGYSPAPAIYPKDLEPIRPVDKPIADTLTALAEDHVLYSHALFFTHGLLKVDPVPVFFAENKLPSDSFPFIIGFDRPIFDKLPSTWSSILFAVPKPQWNTLAHHLRVVSGIDRPKKLFWQTIHQELPIADWWAINKSGSLPSTIPSVKVQLFGVDSNIGCWHFAPPVTNLLQPVRLLSDAAIPDTVLMAKLILSGNDNLYFPVPVKGA